MKPNPIVSQIPDSLPDCTKPVFTPKEEPEPEILYTPEEGWLDEITNDYTRDVVQGMQEILEDRPQLTRSEAEEQMHLTELRRLAEAYTENDAIVISQVLAKKYPFAMMNALSEELYQMKYTLDTITGAVNENTQQ